MNLMQNSAHLHEHNVVQRRTLADAKRKINTHKKRLDGGQRKNHLKFVVHTSKEERNREKQLRDNKDDGKQREYRAPTTKDMEILSHASFQDRIDRGRRRRCVLCCTARGSGTGGWVW